MKGEKSNDLLSELPPEFTDEQLKVLDGLVSSIITYKKEGVIYSPETQSIELPIEKWREKTAAGRRQTEERIGGVIDGNLGKRANALGLLDHFTDSHWDDFDNFVGMTLILNDNANDYIRNRVEKEMS